MFSVYQAMKKEKHPHTVWAMKQFIQKCADMFSVYQVMKREKKHLHTVWAAKRFIHMYADVFFFFIYNLINRKKYKIIP